MAFDDLRVSLGACAEKGSCSFESDVPCEFEFKTQDKPVTWNKASQSNPFTAASSGMKDHTLGDSSSKGVFVVASADNLQFQGLSNGTTELETNSLKGEKFGLLGSMSVA